MPEQLCRECFENPATADGGPCLRCARGLAEKERHREERRLLKEQRAKELADGAEEETSESPPPRWVTQKTKPVRQRGGR